MKIKSIEQTINTIQSTYSPAENQSPTPIKQQLILNYIHRVTEKLTNIINQNKENRSALADHFSLFLTENWSLVKGNLLSYTALPTHEITLLLCSIAEEVAKIKNTSVIAILMPNINLDSLDPSKYPNLDELDIRQIIKTYVLNQDATFLIPISFLFKEEILQPNNIFNNFYYDVDKDEEEKINLKEEDLTILANHSSETKHIFYLKTQYQTFVNDQDTLLGQLNKLNQELLFNSKLGIGQEMHAGEGIYGAIINFNHYWSQLSIEIRKNLPSEVLNEINELLKLASPDSSVNQNRNRNHQNIINTCLATRRSVLENTIKNIMIN
ncbi:hypothetical protein [Rickettsiella massiliensis]|uniref:hypothetical protein n=1 Tax=Rickettsiella massiliensis TaxID=676517 RepID=UPI0002DF386F|nr:hypothetical protein [Rickettsiella massiliensis]